MSKYAYIAHHGIKGQKWGIQNGPPYPIGSDGEPKGAHRHIVKSKLSDKQKKLLKTGATIAGVGAAAGLATLAAGGAAIAITRNPALVTNALRTIGGKAVSSLGRAGIMTGKMAIQKLKTQAPEVFAQMLRETGEVTGKSAKNALKSMELSNLAKQVVASGDKKAINKLIINNYDKFKTNSKALGIVSQYVDDAVRTASDSDKVKLPTGAGLKQIMNASKNIKEAKTAGGKVARVAAWVAPASIAGNAITNMWNDINKGYNTKNSPIVRDIKKVATNALVRKNHYDNYDEKERRKK